MSAEGELPRASSAPVYHLRLAREEDVDAISEIEKGSFLDPWSRAGLGSMLKSPTNRTWVAASEESTGAAEIDGFVSIRLQPPEAEVLRLAVRQSARRRGLGARLLEHALEFGRKSGVTAEYLEVRAENEPALALYRESGFRLIGVRRHYYSNGDDALVLSREEPPIGATRG